MGFELPVQVVQHDAGFDDCPPPLHIQRDNAVEVLREVDHQPGIDRLAGLAGPAAAGSDRHAFLAGDFQRRLDIREPLRHQHRRGHDLVERGVGCVAPSVEGPA